MNHELLFVSYSRRDKVWLDRLLVLFKPFERDGKFNVWADPYVEVG